MQQKMPLISIVVPVYNVEKYLRECVESIEAQTIKDRQVILVDDGSTDTSGQLCDELAKEYSDIKVVHKENGGLASARNAGLKVAVGTYVGFVDSDDLIEPDMYESLLKAIETSKSRVACCCWYRMIEKENGRERVLPSNLEGLKERVLTGEEALKELLLDKGMTYSACDKLFERSLFDKHPFPAENLPSEDIPCIYGILSECDKVVHIGAPKYLYRVVHSSISQRRFQAKNISTFAYMEDVEADVLKRFPVLKQEALYALIQSAGSVYARLLTGGKEKEFREIAARLKKAVRKRIWACLKNPYFSRNAKLGNLLIAFNLYPLFLKIKH